MEEKYGPNAPKKASRFDSSGSESSDSEDEDEDETAVLATVELDHQIAVTLAAIRKKDPRVYDGKTTFYAPIEDPADPPTDTPADPKPVYLRDYHLSNLLNTAPDAPKTFVQEQEDLKRTVVKEIHQAALSDDDDDDFLTRKPKPPTSDANPATDLPDPALADKNPEEFLDKFLSSRAWAVPPALTALESDDSEHEETAEAFEKAYNFRFENPSVDARSVLTSYGRDAISANTVRREDKSARKKAREAKRERREREKEEREREKGRLRKLKTEELMEKFKMIREAAGLGEDGDEEVEAEVLEKLLEGEWSDGEWAEWMEGRFGEEYYEKKDGKIKKPDFGDDIDIGDIVPDFEEEAPLVLDDDEEGGVAITQEDENEEKPAKHKDKKSIQKEERKKKQKDKELKRKLEAYVEDNFDFEDQVHPPPLFPLPNLLLTPPQMPASSTQTRGFRYRQTTPESYGLNSLDILTATDQDLNTYVGLKKLASFREPDKKRKDKKRYGKKQRLREWRKEVFGDEKGVAMPIGWKPSGLVEKEGEASKTGEVDIREAGEGERKKKRRKKSKS